MTQLHEIEVVQDDPRNDGLRLIVESLAGYDTGDIARAIKLRALRRCAS